jgi:hypothetical protein
MLFDRASKLTRPLPQTLVGTTNWNPSLSPSSFAKLVRSLTSATVLLVVIIALWTHERMRVPSLHSFLLSLLRIIKLDGAKRRGRPTLMSVCQKKFMYSFSIWSPSNCKRNNQIVVWGREGRTYHYKTHCLFFFYYLLVISFSSFSHSFLCGWNNISYKNRKSNMRSTYARASIQTHKLGSLRVFFFFSLLVCKRRFIIEEKTRERERVGN